MTRKIIDIGQRGNDGTGDSLRESFRKINDNFQELYSVVGLGELLTFTGLIDTPDTYIGNPNAIVAVNGNSDQLVFKQLVSGEGVSFNITDEEIAITAAFSSIQSDDHPQLGGPLNAFSGGDRYPLGNLMDLTDPAEVTSAISKLTSAYGSSAADPGRLATNKAYVDSKLSLAGIDTVDPATGATDTGQGIMTGPLILSRNPTADDDVLYDGLIAATKNYVDSASYYSRVNLYVSTAGDDHREGLEKSQKGRALAYAFRSIEFAARRAEEIILESPLELGPYRKRLTYGDGAFDSGLTAIVTSPLSGVGCVATAVMSADSITINNPGADYLPGDLISIVGGVYASQIVLEVLTSDPVTGGVVKFKINTTGAYTVTPGATDVGTTTNSVQGVGLTVDILYNVNSITVTTGGSGYDLVSVRITGGGGSGAFAKANVVSGSISSVSVTSAGSGFTSSPNVTVELPRFKISTGGLGTDFTRTPGPSRDIREGLYLRGESSGALANILAHDGTLDGEDEVFDVDIVSGAFQIGEKIQYGDPVKLVHVTIIIESGIYEENFPIKVPANVSIMGDEFRRTIIRPRSNKMSTSPWANIHFCRDTEIDGLTVTSQRFGYHYLTDASQPIYPLINNPGEFAIAAELLTQNRAFIQEEIVGWIDAQINIENSPFTQEFTYNKALCKRDVGLIIDSMVFDLKYGGQNRTVSAALKYYEGVTALGDTGIAIGTQKAETLASINRTKTLVQAVLTNTPPDATFGIIDQVINPALIPEVGYSAVVDSLFGIITNIIDNPANFNAPKNADDMDVFLMNDATRLYQQTIQGAGGFALVLDPEGQILTKSPYAQVGTVFSKSTGRQIFAGSLFIDGFAGNQQFLPINKVDNFTLNVGELVRKPQTPFSFYRNGIPYRVNFIRNYVYNPAGSTAQFILDENTPYTPALFTYDQTKCRRDVGLIIDAVTTDLVFGTNYQSTKAGLSYRRSYTSEVVDNQLYETIEAINYARDQILAQFTGNPSATTIITSRFATLTNIISRGATAAPVLIYPNTVGAESGVENAGALLQSNRTFIRAEIVAWINAQIAGGAGIWNGFTYNSTLCSRDVGYIVDALTFDLIYGGDSATLDTALSYLSGAGTVITGQEDQTALAFGRLKTIIQQIVVNTTVTASAGNTEPQIKDLVNPGSAGAATTLGTLTDIVIGVVSGDSTSTTATPPSYSSSTNTDYAAIRVTIQSARTAIQDDTIVQINDVISKFELVTPGNRSMLSNDFTCVNDMGYGLLASNGGLTEAVSMFTYYCYTAYYSLNGGQIRSVGGSCANGMYALKAEGSDPVEIPDIVSLVDNISQGATVYDPTNTAPYKTEVGSLTIYVTYDDYVPYNQSEIEIDHAGTITRYLVNSADTGGSIPAGVAKLNLSTTGANNTSSTGLIAAVADGTRVTIRSIFEVMLDDVDVLIGTRPSTALVFVENPDKIYRILSASTGGLSGKLARMTLRENYDFVDALVYDLGGPEQPADHGEIGDFKIAINDLSPTDALRVVGTQFGWIGTIHTVTKYESSTDTGQAYGRLTFSPALADAVTGYEDQVVLKCGAQAGLAGDITSAISTARFTGHDLLDIGTGSYADTNYPNIIFGIPANPKKPENEVVELRKGRVFYVTTDQDGNFRVGPYFQVDQGTGTVTFAASIALSSLDGLGFKRGVAISEFSTDDTMTDNATDTVPVEQAIRGYIDRRLGKNHNDGIVDPTNLIPALTGGYMALDGSLGMKANMDLDNNNIINVADPVNDNDVVTKRWMTLNNLRDNTLSAPNNADLLTFTGVGTNAVNATVVGDVTLARSGNTITTSIGAGVIVNADINASAAIAQSKLTMNAATTRANATGIAQADRGLASFDSAQFNVTNGWATVKDNGLTLAKLEQLSAKSVAGNNTVTTGNATSVAFTTIVDGGGAVKKSQYAATGYLKRTSVGDNTLDSNYGIVDDATGNVANTLVRRDSNGDFAANIANFAEIRVDSKTIADTETLSIPNDTGLIKLFSFKGTASILLGDGSTVADKKNYYRNNEHVFQTLDGISAGTINLGGLTTGGASTSGSITGAWALLASSSLDTTAGTLKSTTITTGGATTAGTLTGAWSMGGASGITFGSGVLDITSGTLKSDTLTTGASATAGSITGTWTVTAGSSLVATSVVNQANSATITATSANTANQIVQRDASGNFSAGTITAALSGNASTATSAGKWTTSRTITLSGDLSGSVTLDGSADVTLTATVGANNVALGTDTTGQYAKSITISGVGITANTAGADDGTDYTISSSATSANTANTIVYRGLNGDFSAGTITANLTGTASQATNSTNVAVTNATDNVTYNMSFVANTSGNNAVRTSSTVTYNPSTSTLTLNGGNGTFTGNLTGTASQATTANALNTTSGYQVGNLGVGVTAPGTAGQVRINNSLAVGNTAPSGTAGEIRATNNITAYYSDERLKTRLGKIENALDKVDQLSGFYYEANQTAVDLGYEIKREVGVSAQEVEAVMPEIVAPAPIDDKYLTVRYERLAPLLIEAIKELRAEVNEIKKKLG